MPWLIPAAAICVLLLFIHKFLQQQRQRRHSESSKPLPPGPFQWPLIGCLPSFPFHHRHRQFHHLSQKFGPVISMPIGSSNLFILHGKHLATELLRSKDAQFSSRPLSMTGHYIGFNHSDPNLSPLNANWRTVRKAFSHEIMAPFRLNSQQPLRRQEILDTIRPLLSQGQWIRVHLRELSEVVVSRIINRMLFGERLQSRSIPIEEYLTEGNFLWGELNLADYFPVLAWFDLQGLERRFRNLMLKLEPLFRGIIDEHRRSRGESEDVIDILLQNGLSDEQIMGILSDALIPGISTTAAAVEWAMAELAANPKSLISAQEELDEIVGRERLMDESDIPNLPFLRSVAKEVLRLHPSAPLDDPHLNEEESSLGGFRIPAKSTVLLNLWALGRDPELWERPEEFQPERFLGSEIDVHGGHFELLPFSSGRRKCPAHQLAMIKLQHIVGVLIHGFEWRSEGAVDLEEGDGIVASPKMPLVLSAKPRLEYAAYF